MKKINVAIDGYSSVGKSTIAKRLAQYAGYNYVDTGAMYRAVALYCLRSGEDPLQAIEHISVDFQNNRIHLNGEDVEDSIRTLEVGNKASQISPLAPVRQFLVAQQQKMGERKGIVMDGRDIGTVVFPHAEFKIFLTASPQVRAMRRYRELLGKGMKDITLEEVAKDVADRDYRDTHREESPLRQAEDAYVLDNSDMELEDQLKILQSIFDERTK